MIFDSQDQKEFIFKIMRAYVCSYGESLGISQVYAPPIQSGTVISEDKQKAFISSLDTNGNKPEVQPNEVVK